MVGEVVVGFLFALVCFLLVGFAFKYDSEPVNYHRESDEYDNDDMAYKVDCIESDFSDYNGHVW